MENKAVATAVVVAIAVGGCGGGGNKNSPPSNDDLNKIEPAQTAILGYCQQKIGGSGAPLEGDVANDVDTLISEYKAHPTASFKLAENGTPTTMKQILRNSESALAIPGCAPDQAQKIDQALAP